MSDARANRASSSCCRTKKMEDSIATRVRRILDHVAGSNDIQLPSRHLSAINCSSSLNSMPRRYHSRMLFPRQGSATQPSFMKKASVKDNQAEPMFSRKARVNFVSADLGYAHLWKQDSTSPSKFAEASSETIQEQPVYCRTAQPSFSSGLVWSPRIDVSESCSNYFVIVELPGVNINEIRVEVDEHNIIITGKRILQQQWSAMNSSADSNLTYHRKDILQGPYEVKWSLPKYVDKDCISAEFVDGFLRILIPKI